jgi:hypothetical protein
MLLTWREVFTVGNAGGKIGHPKIRLDSMDDCKILLVFPLFAFL